MKNLLAVLTLTASLSMSYGQKQGNRPSPPSIEERVEKATSNLNLSEEQAAKWTEIMKFYEPEMKKAHDSQDRESMQSIRNDMNTELSATLDEEQKEQFAKIQQEHQNRMKSQRPQGRGQMRQR